jgi:hypothetical protein
MRNTSSGCTFCWCYQEKPHIVGNVVELTLGPWPLTWVIIVQVSNRLILGLDILNARDISKDLGCQVLGLGIEKVLL